MSERTRSLPRDPSAWADLGLARVQQARTTADAATYAQAEAALRKSLALEPSGNYRAETGMGALAAARHDFDTALTWADRAVESDPYGASAHGVRADALTQLGRYQESFEAIQRMTDLRPDAASLARASYSWELRGDIPQARALMARALDASANDAEEAFVRTHLATLAQESGNPRRALSEAQAGLRAARDPALLEARGRAHAALGKMDAAVRDFTAAIAIAPLPHYLLGLGELQQSRGRTRAAKTQYALLRTQDRLRRAAHGSPDVDNVLFEADHGSPRTAVAMARGLLADRPFLAVHDAAAWALHRTGRDDEALQHADQALALDTRSALFRYHRAMIHRALGDHAAARADLERALAIDPAFHPLHAPTARTVLGRIDSR
ncbi:tetratricopeptide repeat protein [Streptomyces boninensis]|uniref:tetratricopeptide repeat protein n=1 Tax=Streptomyces boninensis TaxID=2039455 RepID=UPI003B226C34